ncbi:hypothetical protein ACJX0J_002321, partial [Zea mays]
MDLPGPIHEILVLFGGFGLLLGGLGVNYWTIGDGLLYSFNHTFDLIDKELCLFIFDCRNMKSNLIFLLSIMIANLLANSNYLKFNLDKPLLRLVLQIHLIYIIENFYVEKENLEIQCHILNDTLGWIMGFSGQNVSCLYYFIMSYFPWLTILVVLPIFAGSLIFFLPHKGNKIVRWYTIAICLLEFLLMTYAFCYHFQLEDPLIQLKEDSKWIDVFEFHWRLGIDGLSLGSILLTGFITTLATLAAWPVTRNSQLFYFLMLAMYSGQIGLFSSRDLLLFFIMWELELIPVYLLLSMWGGKRRLYSATKFILYTAGGSIFFLIGVLGMGLYERLINQSYPTTLEILLYFGFLIAYAVKLPIIPLHTCTCMLLAGILLKMGAYGLIRVNMELLPHAHYLFSPWLPYSSVSHMGFIIIGIGSITNIGLNGAILQTIISWIYRTGGISIPMPKIFTIGFVAELVVFFGLITSPKFMLMPKMLITFVMAIGMILTPIYLLSMFTPDILVLSLSVDRVESGKIKIQKKVKNAEFVPFQFGFFLLCKYIANMKNQVLYEEYTEYELHNDKNNSYFIFIIRSSSVNYNEMHF